MRSRVLVVLLLLCAFASALRALDVPPAPTRWVTDRAGILSTTELSLLDSKLQSFEQASGAQFIIYIFPSLEGDSLEEFTIRAARQWEVGQAKYKNGLVLFVFVEDKKVRIEVGDGLEGTMTDAFSSRVIREILAPPFQRGAYAEGLNAAADAIIKKIRTGEEPVPPHQPEGGRGAEGDGDISPFTIFIILFVVFFIILPMLGRRRSGCGGCLPLLFFSGGGGGITFGGGGGRFSSGGGFGGGGFSGGGGGFSGGGASGGW